MRLLYNFLKDMRLSSKSFYFYMEIGFTVIIIAVLLFVVPENFETNLSIYLHLDVDDAMYTEIMGTLGDNSTDEITVVDSRESLEEAMAENRSSVGLSIYRENDQTVYNFVLQGYEEEKFKNIIKTTVETAFANEMFGDTDNITITTLNQGVEKLSDRINMIPIILTMNVSFMGLFIIASYIFLDKEEGTIRALAVTPNRMWEYLLGKMGVLLVSGVISGFLLMIVMVGTKANYLHFTILLISTSLFGSALGLFVSSFFDTMTKAMGWLFMIIIIFALAATSYFTPSFSPMIIKFLPSYPIMFAFREVLLNNPDIIYIYTTAIGFGIATIFLFVAANYRFKKTLTI